MEIRKTKPEELEVLLKMYEHARTFMANNCKTGECQKNSRQSDSFIVLKKLGNANGGKGAT